MPTEHGEIRYDRADMLEDAQHIADLLDAHGRASFRYAAFGTLHVFSAIESRTLLQDNLGQPLWLGGTFGLPDGVGRPPANSHTLWVRLNGGDRGNEGRSAWLASGGYHVPNYVAAKFCNRANPIDGLGLAVLMLLVEGSRDIPDAGVDSYARDDAIKAWVEGTGRPLPAYLTKGENHG
jgi:hypothetical protein